jgi:hypothetical protein
VKLGSPDVSDCQAISMFVRARFQWMGRSAECEVAPFDFGVPLFIADTVIINITFASQT